MSAEKSYVERQKVLDFVDALGLDETKVCELRVTPSYVLVTTYVFKEDGKIAFGHDQATGDPAPVTELNFMKIVG
jgi:hypothetical protein